MSEFHDGKKQSSAMIFAITFISLCGFFGGDVMAPEAVEAMRILGFEMVAGSGKRQSPSRVPVMEFPGWGEINGHADAVPDGPMAALRSLPVLSESWPAVGDPSISRPGDVWPPKPKGGGFYSDSVLLVEPRVLELRAGRGNGFAWGEVSVSKRGPDFSPISIDIPLGCGWAIDGRVPLRITSVPRTVRVGFDLSTSTPAEKFFLPLVFNGEMEAMIPIRWTEGRPRQAQVHASTVAMVPGDSMSVVVSSTSSNPIEVDIPNSSPDRSIWVNRVSEQDIEVTVDLLSSAGYGAVPLSVTGLYGAEEHRIYIVSPWPAVLSDGKPVVGVMAAAKERIRIVLLHNDPVPKAVFVDRFVGQGGLLSVDRVLGEEIVPVHAGAVLRFVREEYAIVIGLVEITEASRRRWAKEWR